MRDAIVRTSVSVVLPDAGDVQVVVLREELQGRQLHLRGGDRALHIVVSVGIILESSSYPNITKFRPSKSFSFFNPPQRIKNVLQENLPPVLGSSNFC